MCLRTQYNEIVLTDCSCSFLRFILRGFIQFVLLTPKPPIFPDPPQNRPYIGAIFGINIMCLFFHIYMDRPQAGEATRGYLHGGLAMDFIGQKGPTSKLHLALLDVLVLVLQIITLAVFVARQKAKEASMDTAATSSAGLTQTHDFEERGQHQADHDPADIELQSLNPSGGQTDVGTGNDTEGQSERDRLLDTTMPPSDAHIFDAFNSGQIIIADLNLIETIRTQFFKYYHGPHESTAGDADFAARVARAGLSFRVRIGNRILGV